MDMEAMTNTVKGWIENPVKFARSHGVTLSPESSVADPDEQTHILIVEGFLLYNYPYVNFNSLHLTLCVPALRKCLQGSSCLMHHHKQTTCNVDGHKLVLFDMKGG